MASKKYTKSQIALLKTIEKELISDFPDFRVMFSSDGTVAVGDSGYLDTVLIGVFGTPGKQTPDVIIPLVRCKRIEQIKEVINRTQMGLWMNVEKI